MIEKLLNDLVQYETAWSTTKAKYLNLLYLNKCGTGKKNKYFKEF